MEFLPDVIEQGRVGKKIPNLTGKGMAFPGRECGGQRLEIF